MYTITAINVNDAFESALFLMKAVGVKEHSRNGEVTAAPEPVTTTYQFPTERMLFSPKRDANPFFHIMEGVWMLAGYDNVDFPASFASNIMNYSDDGQRLNGAYGHRWRNHFIKDQIYWIIEHLKKDPDSRRAVMSMWDPDTDPMACDSGSKDVPCNTTIYFRKVAGLLCMTVCCRSNDIIWGCYGANVVHMSMLHEYIANSLGWPVGEYIQISNNWHIYPQHYGFLDNPIQLEVPHYDFVHVPLTTPDRVHLDLLEFKQFVDGSRDTFRNEWLNVVGVPLIETHRTYKAKGASAAIDKLDNIADEAIRCACQLWLFRRLK